MKLMRTGRCGRLAVRAAAIALLLLLPGRPLEAQRAARDPALEKAAKQSLAKWPGTIVVVDVESGRILAARRLAVAKGRVAAPGSAVKPFVLKALVESGKLDVNQERICRRILRIRGVNLDCSHSEEVVAVNSEEALAYSCNFYFAGVAERLTGRELAEILRREGLDARSGLAPGEATGRVDLAGSPEDVQLQALGYSGVEVTPLELLEAYRKLALRRRKGAEAGDAVVFAGLEKAVEYGTANIAAVQGMKVAGKTGTAPGRNTHGTHGFFAGYAPADFPEIAVVVYLAHGRGADAAELARPVFAAYAAERVKR